MKYSSITTILIEKNLIQLIILKDKHLKQRVFEMKMCNQTTKFLTVPRRFFFEILISQPLFSEAFRVELPRKSTK
jgi:hypothetical protein